MNVNDLVPVEFHEQRVLTTKQAAEMLKTASLKECIILD